MNTHVIASTHSYATRLELAQAQAVGVARRTVTNALTLAFVELIALMIAMLIAGFGRQLWIGESQMVIGIGWLVFPMYLATSALARLLPGYGLGAVEELRRVTWALVGVFLALVAGMWLSGPELALDSPSSRFTLGVAGVLSLVFVPLARIWAKAWMIRREAWGIPVVVYGAGPSGARIVRQLQEERGMGYVPVAVFDDDRSRWGDFLDMVPIVGGTERITSEAAVAFLALPELDAEERAVLFDGPLACYGTVVIVPNLLDAPSLWVRPRDFVGVLGLEVTSNLTRPFARLLKRTIDLGFTLVLAPCWMPLVGLLAATIWLEDRASPFYKQERVGHHGRRFFAWKLRTMVPDADAVLARSLKADPDLKAEWEQFYKLEHDPRITRVGRLLRATSLDELPQLINVLVGEMSLVGPRPLPEYHHEELNPRVRDLRQRVRPGITGMWQVSGRSDTGTLGMERWDPYYVRNWSLWLDAVVLVRTLRVVLQRSGAY